MFLEFESTLNTKENKFNTWYRLVNHPTGAKQNCFSHLDNLMSIIPKVNVKTIVTIQIPNDHFVSGSGMVTKQPFQYRTHLSDFRMVTHLDHFIYKTVIKFYVYNKKA